MTPKRAVLLALSSVVLAAQAQDAGTAKPGPLDAACKQDLEAFCGSVQPGEGRMINCLVDHEKELSNTCRRRMDDLRTHGAECKDDIEKFCPSTPRAKGRLAKCLHDHHDELSEDCKALSTAFKGSAAKAPEAAAPAAAAA